MDGIPAGESGDLLIKMNDDLRRARAVRDGQDRARGYRPTIAITRSLRWALVLRPSAVINPLAQAGFGSWVKMNLPGWKFDARHDWWFAPIAQLPEAMEALNRRSGGVNVSAGAEGWLEQNRAGLGYAGQGLAGPGLVGLARRVSEWQ